MLANRVFWNMPALVINAVTSELEKANKIISMNQCSRCCAATGAPLKDYVRNLTNTVFSTIAVVAKLVVISPLWVNSCDSRLASVTRRLKYGAHGLFCNLFAAYKIFMKNEKRKNQLSLKKDFWIKNQWWHGILTSKTSTNRWGIPMSDTEPILNRYCIWIRYCIK